MKQGTQNYLDYIPVKNHKYQWETAEDGSVTIFVENRGIFHWIAQHVWHKPKVSQMHLEEFGSFLWPRMDGEQSLFEIGQQMQQHFGEKAEPLYPRLVQYIKELESYGFLTMKKPDKLSE